MSKFGLLDPKDDLEEALTIEKRLASFPPTRQRRSIDLDAVDAAAAQHGFVSREVSPRNEERDVTPRSRRRRAIPAEPTRHLAIRIAASQYDRFVAYADKHELTYHDALIRLMDDSSRD